MDATTLIESTPDVTHQYFKIAHTTPAPEVRDYKDDLGLYVDLDTWDADFKASQNSIAMAREGLDRQFDSWPFALGERPKRKKKNNYLARLLDCEINNVTIRFILPKLSLEFYPQWLVWAAIGEHYTMYPIIRSDITTVVLPMLSESMSMGPVVTGEPNRHRLLPFVDQDGLYFHNYTNGQQLRADRGRT